MNGHDNNHSNPTPTIIENHYQYSGGPSKENDKGQEIGEVGINDEQIEELQNLMIEQQGEIEGDALNGTNMGYNNATSENNNENNKKSSELSIFETNDIGEPDTETPQFPAELLVSSPKSRQTPQGPPLTFSTRGPPTTGKKAIVTPLSLTVTRIKNTLLWTWINNNCFRPFVLVEFVFLFVFAFGLLLRKFQEISCRV